MEFRKCHIVFSRKEVECTNSWFGDLILTLTCYEKKKCSNLKYVTRQLFLYYSYWSNYSLYLIRSSVTKFASSDGIILKKRQLQNWQSY